MFSKEFIVNNASGLPMSNYYEKISLEETISIIEEAETLCNAHNYEVEGELYAEFSTIDNEIIELAGYCFLSCYQAADEDVEKTMKLYNSVMEAYQISGHGEGIVIGFLHGEYDYNKMVFLLGLACNRIL